MWMYHDGGWWVWLAVSLALLALAAAVVLLAAHVISGEPLRAPRTAPRPPDAPRRSALRAEDEERSR